MERLTIPDVRVDENTIRRTFVDAGAVRARAMEFYWRLKAYEDTGLTPEKVTSLQKDWSDLCTAVGECGGLDRVKEFAVANKDGRAVVLPCKVGDTVYILRRTFDGADVVGETELWWDDIPKLGKTVFLTREEAEQTLRKEKVTE